MRILGSLFVVFICLFTACGPPSDPRNEYQKKGAYPITGGTFHEPVAAVVIDRNGVLEKSWGTGSAFLVDAKKGLFGTAKHVVDQDVSYKLFFCGRAYRAERVLSSVITDVGFIRIVGGFDPSLFPPPYPIAQRVNIGERVFIRGIHPHEPDLQENKIVHGIIKDYYGMTNNRDEFVYDDLIGMVQNLDVYHSSSEIQGSDSNLEGLIQQYTQITAGSDHIISFRGLSGGPTVNSKGEVVGINSVEPGAQGDYIVENGGIRYRPLITLELTSAGELKRATRSLGQY